MQSDEKFNKDLIIEGKSIFNCFPDHPYFFYEIFKLYFFKDKLENIFKRCDYSCDKCSLSAKNCMTCSTRFYKLVDNLNTCVQPRQDNSYWDEDNKKSYFLDTVAENKILLRCHRNCKSCAAAGTDLTNKCLECLEGLYFLPILKNNNCYPKPEEFYYLDEVNKKLIPCGENCRKCHKNGCIECDNLSFKFKEASQEITCKKENTPGYYIDLLVREYKKCNSKCLNCDGKENICNECDNEKGFFLLEEKFELTITKFDAGECFNSCPPNYRVHLSKKYCNYL